MGRFTSYRRVVVPRPPQLSIPDKTELSFVEQMTQEQQVEIYINRQDCEDYVLNKTTGKLEYPLKTLTINGVAFHLRPGKNTVPLSVLQFMEQCQQDKLDGEAYNRGLQHSHQIQVI
jgi:hypothetical protein